MKPYFDTNPATGLLLLPGWWIAAWGTTIATLDDSYSSYAARRKRLVPLVW